MGIDMHNSKLVPEVLELQYFQIFGHNIDCLLVHFHILELHCFSLHHIPNIVVLDLNVLRLVME